MSKKILVVDDEPDIIQLLANRMLIAGYDVLSANNGQEALAVVKEDSPDLIITDVIMPVMDGVDFYEQLKLNPKTKDIPLIVLTSKGKLEENFRKLGINDFVTKPFEFPELLTKIRLVLASPSFRARPLGNKSWEKENKKRKKRRKKPFQITDDVKTFALILIAFIALTLIMFGTSNIEKLVEILTGG